MFSGRGKLGHGTSSRSSNRRSSTIADAGLKTSSTALALTFEVICAANAAPTSTGWLCALEEKRRISLCKLIKIYENLKTFLTQ